MSGLTQVHVIVVSSVRPEPTSAGQIVLHRHLVDQPGMTLEVYGGEPRRPGFSRLVRRLVGRLSRTRLRRWAESFWVLWEGRWLDGELPQSIAHPEKTVVLTVAHGDAFMAALRFARRHGLPLAAMFQDWWPDITPAHRPFKWLLEKRFRHLYHEADLALCVCPGMKHELGEHPNAQVLYPIPAGPSSSPLRGSGESAPFKILYFGNLTDYGSMLGEALEASLAYPELVLQVRGANPPWTEERKHKMRANGRWLDFAPRTEVDDWLASADAFLVPMSFDQALHRRMATSFPSKLAEFAQFGKPLVVWGPEYCSAFQWGRPKNQAICVSDPAPAALIKCLLGLGQSSQDRAKYAAAAIDAGKELGARSIQAAFIRHLQSILPAKSPSGGGHPCI